MFSWLSEQCGFLWKSQGILWWVKLNGFGGPTLAQGPHFGQPWSTGFWGLLDSLISNSDVPVDFPFKSSLAHSNRFKFLFPYYCFHCCVWDYKIKVSLIFFIMLWPSNFTVVFVMCNKISPPDYTRVFFKNGVLRNKYS